MQSAVAAAIAAGALTGVQPASGASGSLSGVVFRDYNADGIRSNRLGSGNALGLEPGEAEIVVSVTDVAGTVWTTTTNAAGAYRLDVANASSSRVRVNFEVPPSRSFLQIGVAGPNGSSDVQFASLGESGVDASVSNPAEYCQHESRTDLVTSCWKFGDQQSANRSVIERFPALSRGRTPASTSVSTEKQVGTTYGLAYRSSVGDLFSSAYIRRYAGLGQGGTGAVYRTTKAATGGGVTALWADLNTLFGAGTAGADPHPSATLGSSGPRPWGGGVGPLTPAERAWFHDVGAFDSAGKVSLGDLEITEDEKWLFVVNLADRQLYRLSATQAPTTADEVSRVGIPVAPNCAPEDSRPFATAFHDGVGFAGVVCTAESTQDARQLRAHIFSFDPTSMAFGSTPVVTVDLSLPRAGTPWQAWSPELPPALLRYGNDRTVYAKGEPQLSAITFDGNDIVLGLRNRFADRIGYFMGDNDVTSDKMIMQPYEDTYGGLMRVCRDGNGGYQAEQKVVAGSACGSRTNGPPSQRSFYSRNNDHSMGAVVAFQGTQSSVPGGRIVTTRLDAGGSYSNGVVGVNSTYGWDIAGSAYDVYVDDETSSWAPESGTFGKAAGLGDLEALCDASPIEIGDRVWADTDADGTQDADEDGIAGVRVQLLHSGRAIASAVTDSTGGYIFTNRVGPSTTSRIHGVTALKVGATALSVWVSPTDANRPTGTGLTYRAATEAANDSDAFSDGFSQQFAIATRGLVDHGFDVGFAANVLQTDMFAVGDQVWVDINENGLQESAEPGLANVGVELFRNAVVIARTVTDSSGRYQFDGLAAGAYRLAFDAGPQRRWTTQGSGSPLDSDVDPTAGTADITLDSSDAALTPLVSSATRRATKANWTLDAGVLPLPAERPFDLPPT